MKITITNIISILLLALMSFFALKAYDNAKSYEEMTQIIVEKHNVSQLSKNQLKKFADTLSFGLYDGYEELLKEQKKSKEVQEFFRHKAKDYTLYYMLVLLAMLLLYFILSLRAYTILVSISALLSLAIGLITPIMMMSIHKEVEYLGDVVLTMESKGVLGSIAKLFDSGDIIVAGALLLFSILLPLLKTLSMLFVAIFIESRFAHTIVHFFKLLGKWSMADVFVVSTFLVYLSASKGEMSRAEVQVGIYFFLAYVIVSMLASLSADKMLQENKEA